jgi:hypothetical protein
VTEEEWAALRMRVAETATTLRNAQGCSMVVDGRVSFDDAQALYRCPVPSQTEQGSATSTEPLPRHCVQGVRLIRSRTAGEDVLPSDRSIHCRCMPNK